MEEGQETREVLAELNKTQVPDIVWKTAEERPSRLMLERPTSNHLRWGKHFALENAPIRRKSMKVRRLQRDQSGRS